MSSSCVCVCVCIAGYDDIETSPYEDIELELVRNTETSKLASIVSGTADTSVTRPNKMFSSTAECTVMMDGVYRCMFVFNSVFLVVLLLDLCV